MNTGVLSRQMNIQRWTFDMFGTVLHLANLLTSASETGLHPNAELGARLRNETCRPVLP